jgi:hypothetical protein
MSAAEQGYDVKVSVADEQWRVLIHDPRGEAVAERACRDAAEARTFASTIRQHLYWLSAAKFREYYRLPEPVQ